MGLALGAGLTVISAASVPETPGSWACAYVAERLPRSLAVLGEDAVSAGETRAARARLSLPDRALSRASGLALARALGGSRLVMARCEEGLDHTTIEVQAFEVDRPVAGEPARVTRPKKEVAAAIDELAIRLASGASGDLPAFRAPSAAALARAGSALSAANPSERARGLMAALDSDPACIDLRLSAIEALVAARDFESAIRAASAVPAGDTPGRLARTLRFHAGAAQLEAGRYAEAAVTFESLLKARETAAALNNLGVARFRLREPDASAQFARAGALSDPRQNDIAFNLALALLFEGRPDQALPSLERSLQATPGDAQTRLLKVWALRLLKRETERSEEWDRLMDVAPSFASLGNPDLARRLERIFLSERFPAE